MLLSRQHNSSARVVKMAGYRQRDSRSLNKVDALAGGLAMVASLLCLLFAASTVKLVPPLFGVLGASPEAPVMWVLASTFLMRANGSNKEERLKPRTLRRLALAFFVLGAVLMIIPALF